MKRELKQSVGIIGAGPAEWRAEELRKLVIKLLFMIDMIDQRTFNLWYSKL